MTPQDELTIIKWTVAREAAAETYIGKLAVAYVIRNRMRAQKKSAAEICWAPWQFSAWNDPLNVIAKWLEKQPAETIEQCANAAAQAYEGQVPDPTKGALYYLNPELTRKIRDGKLPDWWSKDTDPQSEIVIGNHAFRRARKPQLKEI